MDSLTGFWLVFKLLWHLEFDHSSWDDLTSPCRRCEKSIPELNQHWQNIQKKIETKDINIIVKLSQNFHDQISGQLIVAGSEIRGLYLETEYCAVIYNNEICILPRSAWNTSIKMQYAEPMKYIPIGIHH